MLGSTILKPMAGVRISADGVSGCALGMAEVAVGYKRKIRDDAQLEGKYPWLERKYRDFPCKCRGFGRDNVVGIIEHLFDAHVMEENGKAFTQAGDVERWTLAQLVDWVRSVEPKPRVKKTVDATELVKA